ncbi:MAG: type II secretion system F family protein, partial [Gammaproteobacteria bacterium]|nr:type II secretion system F family protein [Gammaproteobacteria bacterium]
MPVFSYDGRTRGGEKISGEMEGPTKESIVKNLQQSNIIPLTILEKKSSKTDISSLLEINIGERGPGKKLTTDELIFFSRQMYTLAKSSVPLMSALDGLLNTTDNKNLAKVIRGLRSSLDEGMDLTAAMQKQPEVFSELYINLIKVGETTGNLAEIFHELGHYLQKEKDVREKVKSALSYPITVMVVIAIGLVVVNTMVLPAFAGMYKSFNAELPLPTRMLIWFSDFTQAYGYFILAFIFVAILGIKYYVSTPHGKFKWHQRQYNLPLVGSLLKQNSTSRFARTMSITSRAGVPMEHSLHIIGPAVGNRYMEQKIATMRKEVERGESVTNAVVHAGIFPGIVVQMISVGEDSGSLDEMVTEVADYYEREIDQSVKTLAAAIEPI